MQVTFKELSQTDKLNGMQQQAHNNLKCWNNNKLSPPFKVEVTADDWGVATLNATQRHGKAYAVLNMANAHYPGGGFLKGGSAQEENMWMRTTCVSTLNQQGIHYNEKEYCFYYDDNSQQLISGIKSMTDEECFRLAKMRNLSVAKAYKVLLNTEPQLCFRGPEIFKSEGSTFDENIKNIKVADSSLSFNFLSPDKIFSFYELRSAAPQLTNQVINWNDKHFLAHYEKDIRRGISAQLDTLIINNISYVILGAWGCGSFKNKPEIVARIYREEIEKRAKHFNHIVFPILALNASDEHNINTFKKELDGLQLDSKEAYKKTLATQTQQNLKFHKNPKSKEDVLSVASEEKIEGQNTYPIL